MKKYLSKANSELRAFEHEIEEKPIQALGIAVGIGLLAGIALKSLKEK
ncbi:MAG: hypothetical protein KC550_04065 [Nanoarchaeota archaeon]|nr:hypothetical protein [Nanoarchaeota archaeon]